MGSGPGKVWVNAIQINVSQNYGFAEMPMPIPLLSAPHGFTPSASSTSTQFDRDIVLVLDRSGSMNEYSTDSSSWKTAGPGKPTMAHAGESW